MEKTTAREKATKEALRRTAKPARPGIGFAGAEPAQEGWFATNHLCFKGGILHQLYKGTDPKNPKGPTQWWWFPVGSIE